MTPGGNVFAVVDRDGTDLTRRSPIMVQAPGLRDHLDASVDDMRGQLPSHPRADSTVILARR